jgi:hypothetical protein
MRNNRIVDIEEEAREKLLHAHLAKRLRQRRRSREVEKHQHPVLPGGMAIPPENDALEYSAAD